MAITGQFADDVTKAHIQNDQLAINPSRLTTKIRLVRSDVLPIEVSTFTGNEHTPVCRLISWRHAYPVLQNTDPCGIRQLAHAESRAQCLDPALASVDIKGRLATQFARVDKYFTFAQANQALASIERDIDGGAGIG